LTEDREVRAVPPPEMDGEEKSDAKPVVKPAAFLTVTRQSIWSLVRTIVVELLWPTQARVDAAVGLPYAVTVADSVPPAVTGSEIVNAPTALGVFKVKVNIAPLLTDVRAEAPVPPVGVPKSETRPVVVPTAFRAVTVQITEALIRAVVSPVATPTHARVEAEVGVPTT